ncbi:ecto-ADP-ribosyltransferase 4-like [Gasterosteus aculeatus]
MRMKMMMAVTVLWVVLLPYGVSGGLMSFLFGHSLDMAKDSVDDMYDGCSPKMDKNARGYLEKEMKEDSVLKKSWTDAEALQKSKDAPTDITKEQLIALYTYTSSDGDLNERFDKATREQGPKYKTAFKYHALHFYLTTAVQTIKAEHDKSNENDSEKKCYTVFHRTDKSFSTKVLKQEVRFGSFASASLDKDRVVSGGKSCFEIYTCMGADVSKHMQNEHRVEVLIPPYEVFKVKKISKRSEQGSLWCDVVYELKSTNKVSNFNCALF